MSLLVGSFVWNRGHIASFISTTAPNNAGAVPNPLFCTESYILALTSAAQTELDTLSASEIILKQFKEDNPRINTIYKRTDNASNFSSNATPEIEKLICDRVS